MNIFFFDMQPTNLGRLINGEDISLSEISLSDCSLSEEFVLVVLWYRSYVKGSCEEERCCVFVP